MQHHRLLKMYPRKRLDISWGDLGYGIYKSLKPSPYYESTHKIENIWLGEDSTFACLSVRTCFDLYLQALNLPEGSEVIMSAMTIDDMITIVENHKLIPVPLDLDPRTLTANPEDLEKLITQKTKLVVFAHLLGAVIDLDPLIEITKKHNILFVEDCAQAFIGLDYKGHEGADLSMFSFGIIKTSTALGGSISTIRNIEILNKIKSIEKNYKTTKNGWYQQRILKNSFLKFLSNPFIFSFFVFLCKLFNKDYDLIISSSTVGFSSARLTEEIRQRPDKALLSVLIRRLLKFDKKKIKARQFIGKSFSEKLPDSLQTFGALANNQTYWVYTILSDDPSNLITKLRNGGFDATVLGSSMHVVKYKENSKPEKLEKITGKMIYLPLYLEMSYKDQLKMLDIIYEFDKQFSAINKPAVLNDSHNVYMAYLRDIISVKSEQDLLRALSKAKSEGLKISIMGTRKNMGGHAFSRSGIVLDMTSWNSVLNIDIKNKTICVQSGALWHDLQKVVAPFGLSIKSMQSSSDFTVGGSLGSNIHGRDIKASSFIHGLISFHLMKATGEIVNVSRNENKELFSLVVGGYGLFGIVLDCTISLVDNVVFEQRTEVINYDTISKHFSKLIKKDESLCFYISEPSTSPLNFLTKSIITTWHSTGILADHKLGEEKNVLRDRFLLSLARNYSWGKELCWNLERILAMLNNQSKISRTNAMRPPAVPLAFIKNSSSDNREATQEYFIPISQIQSFLEKIKQILKKHQKSILDVSNRFVLKNEETLLSYSPNEDCISVMMYLNEKLNPFFQIEREKLVNELTKLAIQHQGTYYITDHRNASFELLKKCYPNIEIFLDKKLEHDPEEIFSTIFYEKIVTERKAYRQ